MPLPHSVDPLETDRASVMYVEGRVGRFKSVWFKSLISVVI